MDAATIITQTQKWIANVVVGCNFCPFAAREVKNNTIFYTVETASDKATCLKTLATELERLDSNAAVATSFLIVPNGYADFYEYLHLVELAEKLINKLGYEGVYQVASFHPQYLFAGSTPNDAANYTNRSPYPMLHLLREEQMEQALENFPEPEQIPERNIAFAQQKGLAYMKALWEKSFS
ncbi:MAG: DUF1415 domain-containing protein [Flavihumibacter sp.]|nr:DUF1415 domain-containing protein [Flavihumibacter sp.]